MENSMLISDRDEADPLLMVDLLSHQSCVRVFINVEL